MNRKYILAAAVVFAFASIFSLSTVDQAQAQVITPACPVGYTCTPVAPQPVSCPAGYICSTNNPILPTPVCPLGYTCTSNPGAPQNGNCPAGYICSTNNPTTTPTNPPVQVSDATVTVNGSPTLVLTYDPSHQESALTATFNLTVTAGHSDLSLYTGMANVNLLDQKGNQAPANVNVGVAAGSKSDAYGRDYTQVVAGNTVRMTVTLTANPKQLFAGSYHGFLSNLYYISSPDQSVSPANLQVPSNHTNEVYIIGEVSPYINSITPNIVSPGQKISVNGVRFNDSTAFSMPAVYIDGNQIKGVDGSKDGTLVFFVVPPLTDGYHSVQLKNANGASNQVSFQVQSSVTPCYTFTKNLQIGSIGADVVALQTFLVGKGFGVSDLSLGGAKDKGYFGPSTAAALTQYQKSVGLPASGYGSFGPLTRAKVNGECNGTNPNPISSNISVYLYPSPSGVSVYKGQSYDVAAYKLHASVASDMSVQSVSLDFNNRLWLYANSITLKDENGTVIGQANNLSASDFAEYKVGGDYRISIPVKIVVKANQSKLATVNISFSAKSDRSSATISILQAQVRAVDVNGVTDTETNSDGARSFVYNNASNQGDVQVSNTSATVGTQTCNAVSNPTECDYPVSFSFSLTAGNSPIYIGKAIPCPVGYSCVANPLQFSGDNTQIIIQSASILPSTGDGSTYYYIAPGQTRQFTYSGVITNSNNYQSARTYSVQVSSISYGTNASNPSSNSITSGLGNLKMTVSFNGGSTGTPIPYIGSITPSSAPVGSTVEIRGSGLNGFEGDVYFYFERSDGKKVRLAGTLSQQIIGDATGAQTARVTIKEPCQQGQTVYGDYSGIASLCDYVQLTPGVYKVNTTPWGTVSNTVNFTITSNTTQPSITVLSPNGGEVWKKGDIAKIEWNFSPLPPSNFMVGLMDVNRPNQVENMLKPCDSGQWFQDNYPNANHFWFNWKVGYNVYGTEIPDGSYKIRLTYCDGSNTTVTNDLSDSYFTITSGNTNNQPPVISGGTFPTSLNVNQQGTWTVSASDPQNGSLSYSVDWGDYTCPIGYTCSSNQSAMAKAFVQSSSFTHSYSSAGTYTITFTVRNAAGLSAQTTSTVRVGGNVIPTVCPAGYICTLLGATTYCPANYTCTAVAITSCPSGYTCYSSTPNIYQPTIYSSNSYSGPQSSVTSNSSLSASIWDAVKEYLSFH
jgi:hypothetical protein